MEEKHRERLGRLLDEVRQRKVDRLNTPSHELQTSSGFRKGFDAAARDVLMPVLREFTDTLRGRVDSAALFFRMGAAGLEVQLASEDDYERRLVFFADDAAKEVRVTHEGAGFSRQVNALAVEDLDAQRVETEVMAFLERLFEEEFAVYKAAYEAEEGDGDGR